MTQRGKSDSDGRVALTIRLYPTELQELDIYVAAANGVLGRVAYDRETAAAAVVSDWVKARRRPQ